MANVGGSKQLFFKGGGDVSPCKYIVATPMHIEHTRSTVWRPAAFLSPWWGGVGREGMSLVAEWRGDNEPPMTKLSKNWFHCYRLLHQNVNKGPHCDPCRDAFRHTYTWTTPNVEEWVYHIGLFWILKTQEESGGRCFLFISNQTPGDFPGE